MRLENVETFYPLSPMQQGMLYHTLSSADMDMYCQQVSCTLEGPLDASLFAKIWEKMIERHAVLRSFFVWDGVDQPVQVVQRKADLLLQTEDWRDIPREAKQERLEVFLSEDRNKGFDLSKAPLFRLALIKLDDDLHQFVWSHHHILLDGWSVNLVLKEVFDAYAALRQGKPLPPGRARPYRDYIVWLQQQDRSRAEGFWRKELKGFSAPTPLVVDRLSADANPRRESMKIKSIRLSRATSEALRSLARSEKHTLNTLAQGAWGLLLSRYSGEQDVMFGGTVSGRPPEVDGAEAMVGVLINTLPVRIRVQPRAALVPWLRALQDKQAEARQYEHTSLVEIHGWSEVPRGLPLFESILVFANYPVDPSLWDREGGLKVRSLRTWESSNYPLNVYVEPGPEFILGAIYDSRRFDDDTMVRMLGHWATLLEGMASHPEGRLSELPLLTPREQRQVLVEWSASHSDHAQERCIHELFEAQVEQAPNAVALVFEDRRLTYDELNRQANQLAHYLQTLGVGPDVKVGLFMERSLELVVAILGILKAGGAYVPLDPAYPKDRLGFMLEDAEVRVLLTQEEMQPHLPDLKVKLVCMDADGEIIGQQSDANPLSGTAPDNLVYVIYTSGSTGKPKGALVTHYNVVRLFQATQAWFRFDERDVWTLFHSYAFDFSVWEMWGALIYGGRVVVVPYWVSRSPEVFYDLLVTERVTVLNQTPSAFRQLIRAEESAGASKDLTLRLVIFGGEALELQSLRPWFDSHGDRWPRLVNMYGITETTVHVTYRPLALKDLSSYSGSVIGVPIPDLRAYVLDHEMRPVPVGVPGEMFVGGSGLGRGYLNRPELTVEKFIPDPFSNRPGERLYRTGDLVRYLPDGTLEYLGRIDHQVKIRGFRIELGEIEAVLAQHPAVRETLVIVREDIPGEKVLVAYMVTKAGEKVSIDELRRFLRQQLPEYMVPVVFIPLDAFPLTTNGKVDRRVLPAPGGLRPDLEASYEAPGTDAERTVAAIWQELLHLERVGLYDNFFDLGGHSLLITQLYSKIKKAFRKEIAIVDLFKYPTVSALAKYLSEENPPESLPPDESSTDKLRVAKSRLQQLSERRQRARQRGE